MWHEKYIGQPYVAKTGDCMALAQQVARQELNIDPAIPEHETSLRAQARQIEQYRETVARKIDQPKDCQPVLFLCRKRFYHIGVAAYLNHETWILHADERSGVVILSRLREMPRLGYEFEGFYEWI